MPTQLASGRWLATRRTNSKTISRVCATKQEAEEFEDE